MSPKSSSLTIRLNPEMKSRLEKASATMPYRPTITAIAERGFELALAELEEFSALVSQEKSK